MSAEGQTLCHRQGLALLPSSYLVPADRQVPAFHPPLLEVRGPAGSAPQAAVGEDLVPVARAVDDQQHDQGKEDPQGGGALALQAGGEHQPCPHPVGVSTQPAPTASPAGCLLPPGGPRGDSLALTVLPLMSLCRPQHTVTAGVPRAPARHVVTPSLAHGPRAAGGTDQVCTGRVSRSPFEEENDPPEFMRGKEMLWTKAGQTLGCARAKPSCLCLWDPHIKLGLGRIILLSWG